MTGVQWAAFRPGEWAELLAQTCLSSIAYTTRVNRQDDVGHDFFCVLAEPRQDFLAAGPFFTVQVKSSGLKRLVFKKQHEIDWVKNLENPYFLLIANREQLQVDIYSAWERLCGVLASGAERIEFYPCPGKSLLAPENRKVQKIYLGEPIISATLSEFMDEDRVNAFQEVMKSWVLLDATNIATVRAGLDWVLEPPQYQTNKPWRFDSQSQAQQFFCNGKNLEKCQTVFDRAATALRLTIEDRLRQSPDAEACLGETLETLKSLPSQYDLL